MPLTILPLADEQMLDGVWSENEARRNLSDVERAALIRRKLDNGYTQQQVAEAWGLSRSQISWLLGLLSLPENVQQANREGRLPARTAYALRDVCRLAESVAGQKWQKCRQNQYFAMPENAPDEFISGVLSGEREVTSDDVRDYLHKALLYAGIRTPDVIAKFDATGGREIVQAVCKGCEYYVSQYCIKPACLAAKKRQWQQQVLARVSEELNVAISNNPADFEPASKDWQLRRQIQEAWDAGIDADWVIGWLPETQSGVRPFADGHIGTDFQLYEGDGRAGIAIGIVGGYLTEHDMLALQKKQAAGKDPGTAAADIPGPDVRATWKKAAEAVVRRAKDATLDELVETVMVDPSDVFQAMWAPAENEWIDDPDKFMRQYLAWLWDKGRGAPTVPSWEGPFITFRKLQDFRLRAGLQPYRVWDEMGTAAMLVLDWWYQRRDRHYNDKADVYTALAEMERLIAVWPTETTDDWSDRDTDWLYELQRGRADIQAWMFKNGYPTQAAELVAEPAAEGVLA
ncbi:MAG: hypothetical protein D6711_01170 [Chloroflexi bacterium]|nr:MAG: hypothetical protein D6711_01170 [Chloroflexota bacterium]